MRRAALIVGSAEQAKDIMQDAMVEMYRRWQTLESPGGYLNRAVLNGCRDACHAPGSVGPYIDRGLKKMKGALQ